MLLRQVRSSTSFRYLVPRWYGYPTLATVLFSSSFFQLFVFFLSKVWDQNIVYLELTLQVGYIHNIATFHFIMMSRRLYMSSFSTVIASLEAEYHVRIVVEALYELIGVNKFSTIVKTLNSTCCLLACTLVAKSCA